MDPLSALSVAAAVVQFVDFGIGLVKKPSDILRDASFVREKVVGIERLSGELLELSGQIQERMTLLQRSGGILTVVEMRLLEACDNCKDIREQIASSIPKIQENGVTSVMVGVSPPRGKNLVAGAFRECKSMYSDFRDSLQLALAESQIVELERNLQKTRSTLILTMISDLWYTISSTLVQHSVG